MREKKRGVVKTPLNLKRPSLCIPLYALVALATMSSFSRIDEIYLCWYTMNCLGPLSDRTRRKDYVLLWNSKF